MILTSSLILRLFFFFKHKTAYGLRISDWSSDVCSSDLIILIGIMAATVLRILFAGIAVEMLQVIGLTLAGGILLLWVAWKMWRELREQAKAAKNGDDGDTGRPAPKTQRAAVMQIVVADLSMSLDNVLAVAGAAREHPYILAFGLVLSIALMGIASKFIARLLDRFHRSEEHTSELQSLMRISYAVFCLKQKNTNNRN